MHSFKMDELERSEGSECSDEPTKKMNDLEESKEPKARNLEPDVERTPLNNGSFGLDSSLFSSKNNHGQSMQFVVKLSPKAQMPLD